VQKLLISVLLNFLDEKRMGGFKASLNVVGSQKLLYVLISFCRGSLALREVVKVFFLGGETRLGPPHITITQSGAFSFLRR
jgi:hypothetical protein